MESIYSSSTHHTRVDGTLNLEVGVSRIPGHPGYQSDAVDTHLLNFENHPGRGIGCDLLGQREVDNRVLVDLVPLISRHAALPEGARHIDLLA